METIERPRAKLINTCFSAAAGRAVALSDGEGEGCIGTANQG
jgi:hypothetical protein